ncbi:MAG TPA: polysaccharide deacetylase family protein [Xanthomonadales bacterium]|nr:polysaccharide deacetylase family protein [Xanthomonadales bacterium]
MHWSGKVPVLTYHAVNVMENTYAENDHIALAADLQTLAQEGWEIVPLHDVVDWHQGKSAGFEGRKVVALTFDDGSWFDYHDLDHPTCGMQRSFFNILKDFQASQSDDRRFVVHATSFVISSPDARHELDKKGLIGKGWWGDDWWRAAQESGLLSIECHSWDHVHPDLDVVAQKDQLKGNFSAVDSYEDCTVQVARAGDYIQEQLGNVRPNLFAYPYGESSNYLVNCYFPEFRHRHEFVAAFSTEPKPLTKEANIWSLPRFVFGRDWSSPRELVTLLSECA